MRCPYKHWCQRHKYNGAVNLDILLGTGDMKQDTRMSSMMSNSNVIRPQNPKNFVDVACHIIFLRPRQIFPYATLRRHIRFNGSTKKSTSELKSLPCGTACPHGVDVTPTWHTFYPPRVTSRHLDNEDVFI